MLSLHNLPAYELAIQQGDYRKAAWFAAREVRRIRGLSVAEEKYGNLDTWIMRLCGCLKRR